MCGRLFIDRYLVGVHDTNDMIAALDFESRYGIGILLEERSIFMDVHLQGHLLIVELPGVCDKTSSDLLVIALAFAENTVVFVLAAPAQKLDYEFMDGAEELEVLEIVSELEFNYYVRFYHLSGFVGGGFRINRFNYTYGRLDNYIGLVVF